MGYHLTADVVSRGKGQSMVAKAAYNSREAITEERTGELKDFSRMRDKPLASFIFVSDPELRDAGKLWNFYDAHETRKNAQLGYSFIAALPHELTDEQREFIVKDFMREQFQRKGVAAQADIHRPDRDGDERNFHVHIAATMRTVTKDGLGKRVFTWEDREKNLAQWRQSWADRGARELAKQGFTVEAERWRYGHLTNEQQRQKALQRGDMEWAEKKAQEATHHLGPEANAMERRGEESDRGNLNRAARQAKDLAARRDAIDGQIADEREKLSAPPKTPEDARERAAAVAAGIRRAMQEKNAAFDPLKGDGYQWWQRPSPSRAPSRPLQDVGAAFWEYWRERVWGRSENDLEKEGLDR
jgi:ATP-dependent exoDNAse (exonuclease V) alpha subunit